MWILLEVTDFILLFFSGFLTLVLVFFVFYFLLFIRVEDRRKRVEQVLPDALQLVAANVRAGVTPITALRMAARPEFGPLAEGIKVATAKSLGTEPFTAALKDITRYFKSEVLERTIGLFSVSMRSGGNLAALLENTANEIIEAQELRRELIASTNMYVVFILFTMILGMPVLFSISIQFVEMIGGLQAKSSGGQFTQELGIAFQPPVSALFIEQVALTSLIVTSVFASMLIGVIQDGSEWYGLRYAPLFAIASVVVFYAFRLYILKAILSI
jgi:archaellum biogenesis protein FlaJ (TadC family)